MKKLIAAFLCAALVLGLLPMDSPAAESWPDNVSIEAEGGIVMDASTGAVLYGKNIHTAYYPASITKILTALIVLENCSLDESVTFSHNAVYNVEAGSTSAGLDEGDVLSVRDCLYALILKSANEAANALAEHVAGDIDSFAEMMNQKAASLGCTDSHFANPSGLNNENHYTSAFDMALIARAALQNETFMKIDSTLYYDLPVTKRNPEGARIYPGHRMIKKNMPEYYEGCLGGKTGYTSLAGNTLVTFARRDGMTLITVILNGHQSHYRDTKALLDFGFQNFQTVHAADFDVTYTSLENDMTIAGLPASELAGIRLDPDGVLTLPRSGDFSSVTSELIYDFQDGSVFRRPPQGAIARVDYRMGDRELGCAYLTMATLGDQTASSVPAAADDLAGITLSEPGDPSESSRDELSEPRSSFYIPKAAWIIFGAALGAAALAGIILLLKSRQEKRETEARLIRRQKRMARMGDELSSSEFDLRMEQYRRNYYTTRRSSQQKRRNHKSS